jgi:2-oxo-4-hydroxy-4-carboxy-5-ureidoimidazoline decarboxylase
MNIAERLNSWEDPEAHLQLYRCCASERWVQNMMLERPFVDDAHVLKSGLKIWLELEEKDWLEAFRGHPKIGDVESLKKKFGNTAGWAESEQGGIRGANQAILEELKTLNEAYEKKFGYIFIICASGKPANQMLEILRLRFLNTPEEEIENAVKEQAKITALRLEKLA